MTNPRTNRRDHVIRRPLEEVVSAAMSRSMDSKQLVELLLEELNEQNIIFYTPNSKVNLFTPYGRVIALLIAHPRLTVREMSVMSGVSETSTMNAISLLIKEKLIKRSKTRGRYEHFVNIEEARQHPDLRRLMRTVKALLDMPLMDGIDNLRNGVDNLSPEL